MKGERVLIFDTTLRDGEQAAGTSLNPQEKLEIARQLEKLGVDIIEAGFPVTSQGDFEAVRLIARELANTTVCALSHANQEAIDRAWEAVKPAKRAAYTSSSRPPACTWPISLRKARLMCSSWPGIWLHTPESISTM